MSVRLGLFVVLALVGALPLGARGQTVDTVFVGTEHSPIVSGFLELGFPTAGFAYAGDWPRGFLPNALRIGGAIGLGATYDEGADECKDACAMWSVAFLAGTVWAVVDAVRTARLHNAVVREPARSLLLEPSPLGGVSVGLRLRR